MILGVATVGCDEPPASAPHSPPATSSSDARSKLLDRIGDINDFSKPRPLVTLAEFFEGNNDYASIGYNLLDSPSPQEWYQLLKDIAKRADVADIRIEVKDLEDPSGWPSTDTIWIITTASPEQVQTWLPERVAPDEIVDGFDESASPAERYELPAGHRALGLWYD